MALPKRETGARILPGDGLTSVSETSQRQLGLLWGTVVVVLLALVPYAWQLAGSLPVCTFKAIVGIPCPTCGITRTILALADLEFSMALRTNPLGAVLLTAFLAGGLVAGVSAIRGRPLKEPRWSLRPIERLGLAAVIVANWAYLISRGV